MASEPGMKRAKELSCGVSSLDPSMHGNLFTFL